MDLIFHDGNKLYNKEQSLSKDYTEFLGNSCGVHLDSYQKTFLNDFLKFNKSDYNIFGDDFKIEVIPKNIYGECVLSIKDYDENQKFETEIRIGFTKSELSQLISLLETMRNAL